MQFHITTTGAEKESIQKLDEFLRTYQQTHPSIAFEHQDYGWDNAWSLLARTAMLRSGADVSEVGAPWVSDFVAMDSLRPFSRAEVAAVGGGEAFFPAPWANVMIAPSSLTPVSAQSRLAFVGDRYYQPASAPGVYALPARVDVHLIYYWKDMLEQAGIDPDTAFTTPEQLENTLERLRETGAGAGYATPWLYQAFGNRNWVYNMASWIWAKGGDFTDEIGLPVFDQPEAIDGMTAYFHLHRYLDGNESIDAADVLFSQRRAAVCLTGMHYHIRLLHQEDPFKSLEMLPRLGAVPLPGPAFVGGTSFVIWRHTAEQNARAAVDLLTRLMNSTHMAEYCYETHMLPSRVDGFAHPSVAADPFLPALRYSLENGRTHPSGRLWMPIADGLAELCRNISRELRRNPNQDTRSLVERQAHALVERLRRMFEAD